MMLIGFVSCEKDIDIKLDDTSESLVVDGSIENGMPPLLFLSKSLNYFSQIRSGYPGEFFCTERGSIYQ